jgi:methionine synthase I (cobalamin-dependent)
MTVINPKRVFNRIRHILFIPGRSTNYEKLDGSTVVQSDSLDDWGDRMVALNKIYGVKILGGCCGTGVNHLKYIAKKISTSE